MTVVTVHIKKRERDVLWLQITIPMDERRQRRESQDMYNKYTIRELSTNLTDVSVDGIHAPFSREVRGPRFPPN